MPKTTRPCYRALLWWVVRFVRGLKRVHWRGYEGSWGKRGCVWCACGLDTTKNAFGRGGKSSCIRHPPDSVNKNAVALRSAPSCGSVTPAPTACLLPPARSGGGSRLLGGSRGARHDLHDLLGDRSLARTVVLAREVGLEGLRVVRRRLHRLHTRGQLRSDRLLEHAEHLAVDVQRKDGVKDLERVLLEDHVLREVGGLSRRLRLALHRELAVLRGQLEHLVALGLDARRAERKHGADGRVRGDEGDELGVHDLDAVGLAGEVAREEHVGDFARLFGGRRLTNVEGREHRGVALGEVAHALLAHGHELDLDAL